MQSSNSDLYKKFLEKASPILIEYTKNYPTFKTQFSFDKLNDKCNEVIYEKLGKLNQIVPRTNLFDKIEGLKETCSSCYSFYLKPRNRSAKYLDIELGKKLEDVFITFLNDEGIFAKKPEKKPLNYPDIQITDDKQQTITYCEFKYLSAPFLFVYKKIEGRECYEGSNTLDVGDKIKRQRHLVETEITVPVYYVFWLDYPCIKGIYYMNSQQVYSYIDSINGFEYERKDRTGDFVKSKDGLNKKIAETKKVYLPLYSMQTFDKLMNALKSLNDKSSK